MSATPDLIRALAVLCEPPEPAHARIAAALELPAGPAPGDYVELFLRQVYPYASVYLGAEGMMGGEALDRAAGFWRALGLVPPAEPDHLAALLGLYAGLMEAERDETDPARRALRRTSRRALLWEHLLSWCPLYLDAVGRVAPPYYAAWARTLLDALLLEGDLLGQQPDLPLGLRDSSGLPSREEDAAAWIAALLAPVRSGLVLTRSDLGRCGRGLDLSLRVGERAQLLRALLEQDSDGTVAWLAAEAEEAAARHAAGLSALGDVAEFWAGRAWATAAALRESAAMRPSETAETGG